MTVAETQIFCTNCGSFTPADHDACEHCGAKLRPLVPDAAAWGKPLHVQPESVSGGPSPVPESAVDPTLTVAARQLGTSAALKRPTDEPFLETQEPSLVRDPKEPFFIGEPAVGLDGATAAPNPTATRATGATAAASATTAPLERRSRFGTGAIMALCTLCIVCGIAAGVALTTVSGGGSWRSALVDAPTRLVALADPNARSRPPEASKPAPVPKHQSVTPESVPPEGPAAPVADGRSSAAADSAPPTKANEPASPSEPSAAALAEPPATQLATAAGAGDAGDAGDAQALPAKPNLVQERAGDAAVAEAAKPAAAVAPAAAPAAARLASAGTRPAATRRVGRPSPSGAGSITDDAAVRRRALALAANGLAWTPSGETSSVGMPGGLASVSDETVPSSAPGEESPSTAQPRSTQALAPAARRDGAIELVSKVRPQFPAEALEDGITEGHVVAQLFVAPDGHVGNVEILSATPTEAFAQAVVQAARQWVYRPTGARVQTVVAFNFNARP